MVDMRLQSGQTYVCAVQIGVMGPMSCFVLTARLFLTQAASGQVVSGPVICILQHVALDSRSLQGCEDIFSCFVFVTRSRIARLTSTSRLGLQVCTPSPHTDFCFPSETG